VLLVQCPHGGRCRRYHVVHEEEEGVVGTQIDALADEEIELTHRQVSRHQVLLLVQIDVARLRGLLHDHGHTVRILAPDLVALVAPLIEGVVLLVLEVHVHLWADWCSNRNGRNKDFRFGFGRSIGAAVCSSQ